MKNSLLFALLGLGFFATSCSTAEKLDQTVDDVYYSPGREATATRVNETKDLAKREQYENYLSSTDEQFLRMKVSNYSRWFLLDDYSYWNDSRYDFAHFNYYSNLGYSNYYGNYYGKLTGYYGGGYGIYSPIYTWGNPYYTLVNYYNPKASIGKPSESGISAYKNKNYNNSNYTPAGSSKSAYNNSNYITPSSSNFSGLVKKVFSSSSANGSYDRAVRTFDNNNSASRSSSYSSSSSNYSAPSSNAGGNSGGVKSSGSSASGGRTTRN